MQCNDVVLLSLIIELITPWSKLLGITAVFGEICKLPPRYGRCKERFANFYYDHQSHTCKTFIYSGCGGNQNNFVHLVECFSKCGKFFLHSSWSELAGDIQWYHETPAKCKLPVRKGWCNFSLSHYYYDHKNKRCRPFIYEGCGGNLNNFRNFRNCMKECDSFGSGNNSKNPDFEPEFLLDTCDQPLNVGPCKANFRRFYYDARNNTCREFSFGGCDGNSNNFETVEDCIGKCVKFSYP